MATPIIVNTKFSFFPVLPFLFQISCIKGFKDIPTTRHFVFSFEECQFYAVVDILGFGKMF